MRKFNDFMITVFLLSDSHSINSILKSRDYLFNENVSKLIILEESIGASYFELKKSRINIQILKDINECIEKSDVIIIDNINTISIKTKEMVLTQAQELNKKCYTKEKSYITNDSKRFKKECKTLPSILLISLSNCSQYTYIELLLNSILSQINVNARQAFSVETYNLLCFINMTGLLNPLLLDSLKEENNNKDEIIINCLVLDAKVDLVKNIQFIKEIMPDFIIAATENSMKDIDLITNVILYNGFSGIDAFVQSHYYKEDIYSVYCDVIIESGKDFFDIELPHLEDVLKEKIINKLSFPIGIVPVG